MPQRVLAVARQLGHDREMPRLASFLALLLIAAPAEAAERSPAGAYRLAGEQDVASGLLLKRDGRFQYFLAAGALDERAEGRWSSAGGVVTLVTEPAPRPPVFEQSAPARTQSEALSVKISSPQGSGIAGVDVRVGFDAGELVESYTQEDGWSLPVEEKRVPRWIELAVPMHGLASPRFPIDLAAGNALAFTLVPNDLGVIDFRGIRVEQAGKALIVHRGQARLRYEAVKAPSRKGQ